MQHVLSTVSHICDKDEGRVSGMQRVNGKEHGQYHDLDIINKVKSASISSTCDRIMCCYCWQHENLITVNLESRVT